MRLSDERLDALMDAMEPRRRRRFPAVLPVRELAALIAEVRALRKCDEALADLEANGTRVLDVNHHAGQSVWTAVQDLAASLIRARAALAAVRELEG